MMHTPPVARIFSRCGARHALDRHGQYLHGPPSTTQEWDVCDTSAMVRRRLTPGERAVSNAARLARQRDRRKAVIKQRQAKHIDDIASVSSIRVIEIEAFPAYQGPPCRRKDPPPVAPPLSLKEARPRRHFVANDAVSRADAKSLEVVAKRRVGSTIQVLRPAIGPPLKDVEDHDKGVARSTDDTSRKVLAAGGASSSNITKNRTPLPAAPLPNSATDAAREASVSWWRRFEGTEEFCRQLDDWSTSCVVCRFGGRDYADHTMDTCPYRHLEHWKVIDTDRRTLETEIFSKSRFLESFDCTDCGLPRSVCKRKRPNKDETTGNMHIAEGVTCQYKGILVEVYAAAFVYEPHLATELMNKLMAADGIRMEDRERVFQWMGQSASLRVGMKSNQMCRGFLALCHLADPPGKA